MRPLEMPLSEWLPDQITTNNMGLEVAKNVVPSKTGFKGYPSFVRQSTNTLDAAATGLFSSEDGTGSSFTFAGDAAKLYRYNASLAWDDVSKVGGYTNSTFWDFTLFEDTVIATNFNDVIQSYTVGTSALFADLGNAPQARYVATVRDHVLAGYVNDGSTVPYRVSRSARGDPTDWTASAATQAGFFDIYDSGPITGLVGGAFGIAFTSGGVHRLTYSGSPAVFQRDEIGNGVGCEVPGSIVKRVESRGELALVYFKSNDGFAVTDGSTVREIGNDRVNEWFFDNFDSAQESTLTAGIFGLKDSVVWSFKSATTTGTENDRYIAFSFSNNKWAYGEIDVAQVGPVRTSATLLDDITDLVDDVTTTVDSNVWNGGAGVFGGIDHEGYLGTFTGPNLSPEFVTGNYRLGPGKTRIGRIWPDVDGTVETAVSYGDSPNQMGGFSANSTVRRGFTTHRGVRDRGNLCRIRVTSDAAFTEGKEMTAEIYKGNV